jgi:hypothetical protein
MCGFSQESYNRIHKLDFEKVKANITLMVAAARKAGYNTRNICIVFHVYQFNTMEVVALQDFAHNLNIGAYPYYAFINDPKLLRQYQDESLDVRYWKEISQDIFVHYVQKMIDNHPRNCCNQFGVLTIDEKCNILPCCCLARDDKSYTFVNIFDDNFLTELENWHPDNNCISCINKGLSPYGQGNFAFEVPNERRLNDYSGTELLKALYKKIKNRI